MRFYILCLSLFLFCAQAFSYEFNSSKYKIKADVGRNFLDENKVELEGNVFDRVPVVVDVDFIDRVGIHGEIVRSAIRSLQWLVVGDEGHIVRAPCFVAAEHVEI